MASLPPEQGGIAGLGPAHRPNGLSFPWEIDLPIVPHVSVNPSVRWPWKKHRHPNRLQLTHIPALLQRIVLEGENTADYVLHEWNAKPASFRMHSSGWRRLLERSLGRSAEVRTSNLLYKNGRLL